MALVPGTRLGPYEVTAQIGVGGMREVYRATDTNLKRQVAIKVLPASVAGDAERLARFQREAEVLASLNHPNIAQIWGQVYRATDTRMKRQIAVKILPQCYHHRVNSLTREVIMEALGLLADRLQPDESRVDLIIVGGAALVLLFGARESTKDVDVVHLDPEVTPRVAEAAARVAMVLELPGDWLNDAAKGYVHGLSLGPVLLDTPTLRVRTLSPMQLLAMKLSAWRDDLDVEDARRLLKECSGAREDVWREVEPYIVPGRQTKARYAFDDLWESDHGAA